MSKLVVGDFGLNTKIRLPDDMETDFFDLPTRLGATIRSDSWGFDTPTYTITASEFDDVCCRHVSSSLVSILQSQAIITGFQWQFGKTRPTDC